MTEPEKSAANEDAGARSWRIRLLSRLESPRVPWIAAVVALILGLPSLTAGYFLDDRIHEYVLLGHPTPGGARGVWDLYRFADASPEFAKGVHSGFFSWWTNLDLRIAFFRPVASLWRWADFRLFGSSAAIPHLETCLVYAALVFVAARLYGRRVGGAAGGLAALGFAFDDGHGVPVMWIANRYALLAALFGLGSVLAHTHARSPETHPSGSSIAASIARRVASPALLAIALLSGETSLGVLGYLAGYAWFVDAKGRRSAVLALAPHAIVAVVWMIAYRAMGYGVSGSAFYVDPLRSPGLFLSKFVVRLPELVLSGVFAPPTEAWLFVSPERDPYVAAGAALLAGAIIVFLIRAAVRDNPSVRGAVAALAAGSAASVIPVCSTIPDDRNFLIASFGFFGILAIAITNVWRMTRQAPRGRRAVIGLLAVVHLVLAPILFPLRALNMAIRFGGFIARGAQTFPSGEHAAGKTVVLVGVPDSLTMGYMMLERDLESGPRARTILSVQSSGTYTMKCIDPDTVEVRNPVGALHSPFAALYTDRPFSPGQVLDRDIDRVEVLETTAKGEPSAIRATIRVPASERIWVVWQGKGLVELPAPQPGETKTFQGVDLFEAMQK